MSWALVLTGCACREPSGDDSVPDLGSGTGADTAHTSTPTMHTSDSAVELSWVEAHAGGNHSCGLVSDGSVRCWGWPACVDREPPGLELVTMSVGVAHMCGLDAAGELLCWCCDPYEIAPDQRTVCEAPPPQGPFTSVKLGFTMNCAQRPDGTLACWGWPGVDAEVPPGPVVDYAVDNRTGVALLPDGSIWSMALIELLPPDDPAPRTKLSQVVQGRRHRCALDLDGRVHCWGDLPYYADGDFTPFPDPPRDRFVRLWGSNIYSGGIRPDGTLQWWGDPGLVDVYGELPGDRFVQVGAGEFHACGVTDEGEARCWGSPRFDFPNLEVPPL